MIGLGQTVSHFDWETKSLTVLHTIDQRKSVRFNDGKCDAAGRLLCGTMDSEKTEEFLSGTVKVPEAECSLYCLDLDGSIRKQKEGVGLSNGLAWSLDNKTMYFMIPFLVKCMPMTMTSILEILVMKRSLIADFDETVLPDGMTIDTENKLWVASFLASKVVRFNPKTGQVLSSIEIPARRITSCCFGGKQFDELFVTCSNYRFSEEELKFTPLAGSVFKVTGLGAKGKPASIFLG